MGNYKKRGATPLIAILIAGFLGLGSYAFDDNPVLTDSSFNTPPIDTENSKMQPELQQPESSSALTREQEGGTCVSVYDGDTITVRLTKSPEKLTKIRFIGIDTPELKRGEFGETTRDFTKSLLLGQDIQLAYDAERYDKYGRSLAYVYLKDRTFVNARLLEQGYARVMTIPPNTAHAAEFSKLQAKAEEKQVGIWAMPPPQCTWRGETMVKTPLPQSYTTPAEQDQANSYKRPMYLHQAHVLDVRFTLYRNVLSK